MYYYAECHYADCYYAECRGAAEEARKCNQASLFLLKKIERIRF
jgi:hypothetical protein